MFYNDDAIPVDIFSVLRLSWKKSAVSVPPRAYCALVYRVKGNADFVFEDGRRICTAAGEIFYCPLGVGYNVTYDDGEIIALHFNGNGFNSSPEAIRLSYPPRAAELFDKALSIWSENGRDRKAALMSVFFEILAICTLRESGRVKPESSFDRASRFYIENAFNNDILISDVCSRHFISESGFRRYFIEKYGVTPVKYITELRLRKAEALLLETGDTVESIAMQCGYDDVKYFCRVFHKYRKCTPTQFRYC